MGVFGKILVYRVCVGNWIIHAHSCRNSGKKKHSRIFTCPLVIEGIFLTVISLKCM